MKPRNKKMKKKTAQMIGELWDNFKQPNLFIIGGLKKQYLKQ